MRFLFRLWDYCPAQCSTMAYGSCSPEFRSLLGLLAAPPPIAGRRGHGLDREFLEEVAFLLSLRVAGAPASASATGEATQAVSATGPAIFDPETGALSESVDDLKVIGDAVERRVIDRVLRRLKGNQSKAAAVLNISRGSLIAKIRQYSLPDYRSLRRR